MSLTHFKGKDALSHVLEKRAMGAIVVEENHGLEPPGYLSSAADALRDAALIFTALWLLLSHLHIPAPLLFKMLSAFSLGWIFWKTGRSAWLSWSKLERIHRMIEQERYEIENHRTQEREELTELYRNKGFEGKLLEEVIDVLMADENRLLKVMLEEEMGITLESYEHPLQQALGAFVALCGALLLALFALSLAPAWGIPFLSLLLLIFGSLITAYSEKNRFISALVWNLSLGILSAGTIYFSLQLFG